MNVVIENCRSIDNASISIEPGKLNVKFAPNGTGKSSIAKALVSAVSESIGPDLVPFKWQKEGSAEKHPFNVSGLNGIASVEVFDEEYVQSVVFQQDSLFPGSFDVFVRTREFINTENKLREQLEAMVKLSEREDVRRLSADLESFLANLVGNSGLDRNKKPKGSSPVVKALKEGNTWAHEDPLLTPFKPILGQGPFKKWAAWHKQGRDYLSLMEGVCPYCGLPASDSEKRIDAVGNSFDSTKVGNIEKTINALSIGSAYLSETASCKINSIVNSADPITEQEKAFIGKVVQDAQLIIDTLAKLRAISSYFVLSSVDNLNEGLSNCKIDIALVDNFNSSICSALAAEINKAVDAAMTNAGKLIGLVKRQKLHLAAALKDRCEEINSFLTEAGYPYSVNIPGAEDGKCSVRLVHTSQWEVPDSREALSYGEKNAFALVFFAYECMSKKPDLVILDDPISSFDGAKRYALLNMLFLGGIREATLKGKTVLLLTHDYGTLFDIEHSHKPTFQPSANSCVLSCVDGLVNETVVTANDMVLADNLYERLAKSSSALMVKLVYARKVLEVRDDKGDAYDVVSSLFHHRPTPTRIDMTPMKSTEINNGVTNLEAIVGEPIDYNDLLDTLNNPTKMLAIFDASSSNYEKLQLARIATEACTDDKVLKERMDESVHVGNGFLYQLDPTRFELVPSQLVKRCREEILNMDGGR